MRREAFRKDVGIYGSNLSAMESQLYVLGAASKRARKSFSRASGERLIRCSIAFAIASAEIFTQ